jgi:hypothetical protein
MLTADDAVNDEKLTDVHVECYMCLSIVLKHQCAERFLTAHTPTHIAKFVNDDQ